MLYLILKESHRILWGLAKKARLATTPSMVNTWFVRWPLIVKLIHVNKITNLRQPVDIWTWFDVNESKYIKRPTSSATGFRFYWIVFSDDLWNLQLEGESLENSHTQVLQNLNSVNPLPYCFRPVCQFCVHETVRLQNERFSLNSKRSGTIPRSTTLHDWMKPTWGQPSELNFYIWNANWPITGFTFCPSEWRGVSFSDMEIEFTGVAM